MKNYFSLLRESRERYKTVFDGTRISPYEITRWEDFWAVSPPERMFWSDIRYLGIPAYPQFPIGRFYADFADPFNGIVFEIDSKYHIGRKRTGFVTTTYQKTDGKSTTLRPP